MSIFMTTLGYELRRILLMKKYGYMVLVALLMAAYVLSINSGVSGTAPFSPPSAAMIMALMGPVWSCIAVLLIRDTFSEKERAVRRILFSAPRSTAAYFAPKVASALLALLLIITVTIVIFACAFRFTYGEWAWSALLSSLAYIALPALLFTFGAALVVGRMHGNALYALFLCVIALGLFNIKRPLMTDWFGNVLQITIEYIIDLRAYAGEPLHAVLPGDFLWGRAALSVLGMGMAAFAIYKPMRIRS